MGTSCGGIAIKTDIQNFELEKIVKDLFGEDFSNNNGYCDSRRDDCVYIGKTKDFIVIVNSTFAEKFFINQDTNNINYILEYFSNPDLIFAFEEYDSGCSYGYALIYNGVITRQYRSLSYETTMDYGEPEAKEKKWLNAETFEEDLGDGETQIMYKDSERDFSCSQDELPIVMLQELMLEKLGFIPWNMDDYFIEQGHFKSLEKSITLKENLKTNNKKNRSWWKIWK